MNLFIDDIRHPPDGKLWKLARNVQEGYDLIKKFGPLTYASFDHDLGDGPTVHDFVKQLIENELDGDIVFDKFFTFVVHSDNPVGKKNIEMLLDRYLLWRTELV